MNKRLMKFKKENEIQKGKREKFQKKLLFIHTHAQRTVHTVDFACGYSCCFGLIFEIDCLLFNFNSSNYQDE